MVDDRNVTKVCEAITGAQAPHYTCSVVAFITLCALGPYKDPDVVHTWT